MNSDIRSLLEGIQNGSVSVDDALLQLKQQPFEDIGYAKVDMHRKIRQGAGEDIDALRKQGDFPAVNGHRR